MCLFSSNAHGQYVTYCGGVRLHVGAPIAHPSDCGLLRVPVWLSTAPGTSFTELIACGLKLKGELSGATINNVGTDSTNANGFNQSGVENSFTESTFEIGYSSGSITFDLDDASSATPHFWIDVEYLTDQNFSFQNVKVDGSFGLGTPTCVTVCTLEGQVVYDSGYPYNPSLSACSVDGFAFFVDVANAETISPNGRRVPVKMQYNPTAGSNTANIPLDRVELDIVLEDEYDNLDFSFTTGILVPDLISTDRLRCKLNSNTSGITFTSGISPDLFFIEITGPESPLTGGTMGFRIENELAQRSSSICCEPISLENEISLSPYVPPCSSSLGITYGAPVSGNNCLTSIPIQVVNTTGAPITVNRILVELTPQLTSQLQLEGIGSVTCDPADICSGNSSCSGIDDGVVTYEKCAALTFTAYSTTTLFTIQLRGEGELQGLKAGKVEIDLPASDACTPAVNLSGLPIVIEAQPRFERVISLLCADQKKVPGVNICFSNDSLGCKIEKITTTAGKFEFPNCTIYEDFLSKAAKTDEPRCGLSTLDIVFLRRHILNIDSFTEPYKYLAGDANLNGAVTTADIILFNKQILGIADLSTPWRFVPSNHIFSSPNPLLNIPDSLYVDDMAAGSTFDAVKVGDINCNCNPGSGNTITTVGELDLEIQDGGLDLINNGHIVKVTATSGFTGISALQFAVGAPSDDWEYRSYSAQQLPYIGADNFHNTKEGGLDQIRMAWHHEGGDSTNLSSGQSLFNLIFAYDGSGTADLTAFVLDTTFLKAIAYTSSGLPLKVNLTYDSGLRVSNPQTPGAAAVSIESASPRIRVVPNPLQGNGNLEITAVIDGPADWWIEDIHGRRMAQGQTALVSGVNRLELPAAASNWPAGVYWVSLRTDGQTASTRFVKQ